MTESLENERVPVIQVVSVTAWRAKKARIRTNVELVPSSANGLSKRSIADCLQTRPVDRHARRVNVRGKLAEEDMGRIDSALIIVFALK